MFQFRLRSLFWLTTAIASLAAVVASYPRLKMPDNRWSQMAIPVTPAALPTFTVGPSPPELPEQVRHPMVLPVDPSIDPKIVINPDKLDPNMPLMRRPRR